MPMAQASGASGISSTCVADRASVLSARRVMAIIGIEKRAQCAIMSASSRVSPELEIRITTSCRVTMPRSPWLASLACTKNDVVPVEASVAAILRPI